ncbi:MAG TPA: mercuric transporter MerT family protein [Gemmatimonadales bacterium]|nr:mercuric transporter MerT family protein [Gemmatimonadales bacterium]
MIRGTPGLAGTAVGAASVSALCCAGPIVTVLLGVSGGALASAVEPFRPLLLGVTGAALGGSYFLLWRADQKACEAGATCASEATRRRTKVMLGIATLVAVILASYPVWKNWF